MNFYKFINSKDIRAYFESINYQFDSLSAAWIVWQSKLTTLQEKHEAWEKIIATMPDCEIRERPNTKARPSLHNYLRKLIELGDKSPDDMSDYEKELIDDGFDGMWFYFPTPFKKGDILTFSDQIFILSEFGYENGFRERLEKNGDSTDMTAFGYFVDEGDGHIFNECMHHYMDLEYYCGELNGKNRILMAVSNYLKDEISLELLLNAYHIILTEEHAKDFLPRGFTNEGLALAGIAERKK